MLKSFKYEFIEELEYDYKGDKNIAEYLEVKAPNNKTKMYVITIQCAYLSSFESSQNKIRSSMTEEKIREIMEISKGLQEEEPKLTSLQTVNLILANSDSKTVNAVYDALEMILKESAKVDGHTNFGSALFEKMTFIDTQNILGEYINSFFTVSPQA